MRSVVIITRLDTQTWLCLSLGVFTVSGILDSFIYHGQKAIKKKMELGKFS